MIVKQLQSEGNILMNIFIHYFNYLLLLFLLEKLYLFLARKLKIEAVPNLRSAHTIPTLLGGGIIIPIACLMYFILSDYQYTYWMAALFCLALVSYIDDLRDVSVSLRMIAQAAAIGVLLVQFNLFTYPVLLIPPVIIIMIISLNAYNFLDGINGMTSVNSLVHLACLYYLNENTTHFIDRRLIIIVIMAVVVFSYFNFRVKAVCFAGDVGSISLAFFVCGCVLKLILVSNNVIFIILLLVYYLDAITTFVFRWMQGQDVFKAHNKHFYLYLVNHRKWSHLTVASTYAAAQLMISLLIIPLFTPRSGLINYYNFHYTVFITIATTSAFIWLRIKLEGVEILKKAPQRVPSNGYRGNALHDHNSL
ncbi:hypothetical protein A0256_13405 [Mucilaginibacter sp. PAMC 26640]|nr:hypothetical protein A0256_13405 [Mucilaginibacter sp. PAMC 26640]